MEIAGTGIKFGARARCDNSILPRWHIDGEGGFLRTADAMSAAGKSNYRDYLMDIGDEVKQSNLVYVA